MRNTEIICRPEKL